PFCSSLYHMTPPPAPRLFPYTTLFRSARRGRAARLPDRARRRRAVSRADEQLAGTRARARGHVRSARAPQLRGARAPARRERPLDRKSTRLKLQSPDHLVCRLLLEKKK